MSVLKYGNTTISPTPVVTIERQLVGSPDGAMQGLRETWRLAGEVFGANPGAIATAYQALETAFAVAGSDLVLYADDGVTVRHSLIGSQTLNGVKVTRPISFPKGEGAELATLRSWSVELSAVKLLAGAPSATAWGEVTTALSTDAQGQVRITVSGRYQGPGAAAAAAAAKVSGKLIENEDVRTNADTQEVSFTYQYTDASAGRTCISWVETVAIEDALSEFVWRRPLGQSPIQQSTVLGIARAVQSGEAVGRSSYVNPAALLYSSANLKSKRVTRRSPRLTKGGTATEYPISWEYVFEFAATPSTLYPGVPPT